MTVTKTSRIQLAPNVHVRHFQQEMVILDLTRGEYFAVDPIGAAALDKLAAGLSVEEVARALLEMYSVEENELLGDLIKLIEQLKSQELVVEREA